MNVLSWSLMLLMLLLAIGLVVFPLLRSRTTTAIAYKDSNLSLYEAKLAELDIDLAEARIDQKNYDAARQELDRELLDNVPSETTDTAAESSVMQSRKHPALALIIAVCIPVFVVVVYLQIGMETQSQMAAVETVQPSTVPSVEEMTAKLEKFLQENEGGVQEWSMLARAYKHLQRYDESINAFSHVLEMQPDAQIMLEKAEAIALRNGQVFNQEALDLVMQARKLEPDNINVLWFAGVAEFQLGQYRASIDSLSRLATVAKSDADVDKSIRFYLEQARSELIAKGETVASINELLQIDDKSALSQSPATEVILRVAVSVSDEVRAQFSPEDTVFIYARAAQGPKMPLAVQRLTLSALPAEIALDDSMAMMAGMNLSAFPSVVVAARISRSGSAISQSGDYIGEYQVNDVNSAHAVININIDRVVP